MRSGVAAACERVLVGAARAQRAGTRQQLRAAARRFVRRHRRDRGYLAWVLRSVGTSSALAVALLGLGAVPAHAAGTLFTEVTGAANPFAGVDVGRRPALADLDADGDLDLVASTYRDGVVYYENTGDASDPVFVPRTGAANPFDGIQLIAPIASDKPAPAFGDLDRDGDLDAVVASGSSAVAYRYLENTGSAVVPAFVERTDAQNPFIGVPGSLGPPTLGDLDGDGDLDLVSGWFTDLRYLENTGDAEAAAFVERTGSANPVGGVIGNEFDTIPALGDLDLDGDLDLVVGTYGGYLLSVENTGSATTPHFVLRSYIGSSVVDYSAPALGDVDADGDLDLAVSWLYGFPEDLHYFENRLGRVVQRTGADNPLAGVDGTADEPCFGDLDGDGDFDLVAGGIFGELFYYKNTGNAVMPVFVQRTGAASPLNGLNAGFNPALALGDLDADGDLDLVAGNTVGTFRYFENTGSAASAAFVLRTGAADPLAGISAGGLNSSPAFADLDLDGDLDLVVGRNGTFVYLENTGSAEDPAFATRTGAANPLDGFDVGSFASPALGDVDLDGDLDVVAGGEVISGILFYFENTGSATSARFVLRTGAYNPFDWQGGDGPAPALADLDGDGDADLGLSRSFALDFLANAIVQPSLSAFELVGDANPLAAQNVGSYSAPAFGDLDADGDLDLISGENIGHFFYFANTGSATRPSFAPRTGTQNPLDGQSVGNLYSTPTLGDLDADGDLDLVASSYPGSFHYFENTGNATMPAFAARTGAQNPLDGLNAGFSDGTPTLGDLDGDGDLDLVAGNYLGVFVYLENTGDAASPAFVPRTGAQNPLDGFDVGYISTPVLGDVDGDGDLDLFAGNYLGSFDSFENTGSATSPAFVQRTGAGNPLSGEDFYLRPTAALADLDGDGDLDV
ncbi:MAG TPA: FG-GAP-like repeat-containing protein, partial [Myxococcota bacterium]|nr:FG-GAP-like repeat-containing protein [Myxococcota bacterium]